MSDNLAYQEERREELIGGKVVMMAPASAEHVYTAGSIYNIFKNYLKGKNCIPFSDGLLVHLTDDNKFVPDMMVVCDRSKIKSDGVHGAPDLVVEVLSPSTAKDDRTRKKEVYEACGVPEYWLVSPTDKSIEVYLLESGKYILHDVYTVRPDWVLAQMTDEERSAVVTEFKCHLYDDLLIRLDDIFGDLF
jgi:Uma2 family endonuclease